MLHGVQADCYTIVNSFSIVHLAFADNAYVRNGYQVMANATINTFYAMTQKSAVIVTARRTNQKCEEEK